MKITANVDLQVSNSHNPKYTELHSQHNKSKYS